MNIGVNKSLQNILVKSAITIGLTFGSMVTTIMGYLFLGCLVGRILHPSTHEPEYVCACSEPPIMTESEATIVGVIRWIGLMIGFFFILRQLTFSKLKRIKLPQNFTTVSYIIASGGDYSDRENGCDELTAMRDSLTVYGIPDSVITLDYQGVRTLNSIVKAKYIYKFDSLTIISQKYHNERAIWLAEHYGLHAIA